MRVSHGALPVSEAGGRVACAKRGQRARRPSIPFGRAAADVQNSKIAFTFCTMTPTRMGRNRRMVLLSRALCVGGVGWRLCGVRRSGSRRVRRRLEWRASARATASHPTGLTRPTARETETKRVDPTTDRARGTRKPKEEGRREASHRWRTDTSASLLLRKALFSLALFIVPSNCLSILRRKPFLSSFIITTSSSPAHLSV